MKAHLALVLLGIFLCADLARADSADYGAGVEDAACPLATPNWGRDLWFRLKRYWSPDKLAESGKHGAVMLHFFVGPDGKVLEVTTLRKKGSSSLEAEARGTVLRAAPFVPPPFADAPCERLGVKVVFFLGMSEKAQTQWLAEPDEVSTK